MRFILEPLGSHFEQHLVHRIFQRAVKDITSFLLSLGFPFDSSRRPGTGRVFVATAKSPGRSRGL